MIPFIILRKLLLSLAPLVLFYLLRKVAIKKPVRKSHLSGFDKNQIIDGEIVEEKSKEGLGAERGTRTPILLRVLPPEDSASTNFAISAKNFIMIVTNKRWT